MSGSKLYTRRKLLGSMAASGTALVGTGALAQGVSTVPTELTPESNPFFEPPARVVERNISSFQTHDWRPYFSTLKNGAILVNTESRSLHFWPETGDNYFIFPTSVPMSEDLTRRGRTSIVRKVDGPEWRPTPNMKRRDPTLPDYVGPGAENPLGTHALYLTWQYYRIHGTNDTRKIGRMSSSGCIGLFNEDIETLYSFAKLGTQVLLI